MKSGNNPWVKLLRQLSIGLAILFIVELAVVAWSALLGPDDAGTQESSALDREASIASLPGVDSYSEVVERPLFIWNRRPKPGTDSAEVPSGGELGKTWTLAGLVKTDKSTYAIFKESAGDRRERLERGMQLDGWTLDVVDDQQAELVNGTKRAVFRLSVVDTAGAEVGETENKTGSSSVENGETEAAAKVGESENKPGSTSEENGETKAAADDTEGGAPTNQATGDSDNENQ